VRGVRGSIVAAVLWGLAGAGAPAAAETLRVGTSGDYPPLSEFDGPVARGFDVDVARAYAEDRGLELELVPFEWPRLLRDLAEGRFDVAMSGITVRPERSAAGRFSVPVMETGAMVLVREPHRFVGIDDLDRRPVRIGVNAGGHLERVTGARFPRATLVAVPSNAAVPRALAEGHLDAAVTDTLEGPHWLAQVEGGELRGPFTRDRKAYLVRPGRPGLARDLDGWLLRREADGSLSRLRRTHFGADAGAAVATPLGALLAAVDERLSLMPAVGVAKREAGLPLEVPEREDVVIEAGVAHVQEVARERHEPPPPRLAVHALYRALIEAAKEVQWEAVKARDFSEEAALPDLDTALRPALLRIGERIARLVFELPEGLGDEEVRKAAAEALRAPHLSEPSRNAIADAIARIARAPGD